MADRVIVVGTTRGRTSIPISEIQQMCGRAGRSHFGLPGVADVIAGESKIEDVQIDMKSLESLNIDSQLVDIDNVAFHLISEISNCSVNSIDDAIKWYDRSFAKSQGKSVDFENIFEYLRDLESVVLNGRKVVATPLGDIATRFYFHPADVFAWKSNFDLIINRGLENDDMSVVWALANVPFTRYTVDYRSSKNLFGIVKDNIAFDLELGTIANALVWWAAMDGPSSGRFSNSVNDARKNYERIHSALLLIDAKWTNWDMHDFFENVRIQIAYKVKQDYVELCKLSGIGKNYAKTLYELGAQDIGDLEGIIDDLRDTGRTHLVSVVEKLI